MTTTLTLRLHKQKSFFLTVCTLSIATGFFLLSSVLFRASKVFVRWCTDFIFAGISGSWSVKAMVLGIFLLFLASIVQITRFLFREWQASKKIRALCAASEVFSGMANVRVAQDDVPFAYTFGLFQPIIVISSGLVAKYTPDEVHVVLRHEKFHATHAHALRGFVWELFCRVFFFLPLARDVSRYFATEREMSADAFAASTPAEKSSLASAMIKMLALPAHALPSASIAGFGMMSARALALAHGDTPQHVSVALWRVVVSCAVFLLVMLGCVASLRPASAFASGSVSVCPSATAPSISTTNFSPYMRVQLLSSPYMVQSILLR